MLRLRRRDGTVRRLRVAVVEHNENVVVLLGVQHGLEGGVAHVESRQFRVVPGVVSKS